MKTKLFSFTSTITRYLITNSFKYVIDVHMALSFTEFISAVGHTRMNIFLKLNLAVNNVYLFLMLSYM